MTVEERVRRWWSGGGGVLGSAVRLLTTPLEWLFRGVVAVRGKLYDWRFIESARAPIPVISVGNLTVGGTGKTPIVRWIVDHLREQGARPAVLVRGFADEVALHRRWYPDVPVVEDSSRARGAATAAAAGATVAVLDDGFQHRRIARDLDIVVVAVNDVGPVRLLPRGPYRESGRALRRADLILLSDKGDPADEDAAAAAERARTWVRRWAPSVPVHRIGLGPSGWQVLDGGATEPPQGPVLGVAGIGAPETFRRSLEEALDQPADVLVYSDHRRYDHQDVHRMREEAAGRTIVVTEKDAVKLARFPVLHAGTRVLTLGVRLVEDEPALVETLRGALSEVAAR